MAIATRARAGLAAAAVLAGLAVPVALAAPASASSCAAISYSVSACSTVTAVNATSFKVAYRDSAMNGLSSTATLECKAESTTSSTYSVSATVEAKVKAAIFAEFTASVTGGVSQSMTSTYGSTVKIDVPANSTRYCTYGIYVPKITGYTSYDAYSAGKYTHVKTVNWTSTAPQRLGWKLTSTPI
ncbi:hypothetical protein [Cellulomonas edaphi]|uniref:Spore coat protein U domain-containing protein n=1 Tax=Cellulomonas edaphi TaxID=3053468 RepID=A0ABT7S5E1_9CELL|nr:hypothetical protein [Cellulomons edaphi]MDM7830833.1 hypothetical protein [Cellulomons edaphi]